MIPETEILIGDVRAKLRELKARGTKVQCVVTSPPYWALRDYGTEPVTWAAGEYLPMLGVPAVHYPAWSGELGLEPDPVMFVGHIVEVFAALWDVLADDGVCWMNFGDCYAGARGGAQGESGQCASRAAAGEGVRERSADRVGAGLKPKDMAGIPWRVALALQAAGWWLRRDVIWHKPSPMPETVSDRPSTAHEYVFLLTKAARYVYDAAAIREAVTGGAHSRGQGLNPKALKVPAGWDTRAGESHDEKTGRFPRPRANASMAAAIGAVLVESRNARSVWTIPSEPYSEAHYATFPKGLVRRCVLAGSRPGDVVLDIFGGSGTTAAVANEYGRHAILIDLNPANERLMRDRLAPCAGQGVLPV